MPKQTGPRRTQFQIDRDRQYIAGLYLRGYTQAQIAETINADPKRDYTLTQQTISNDLKRIREAWLTSALMDFNEAKAQELARIDQVEREAWAAWERSQEDAESKKMVEAGSNTRYEAQTKGQTGDPRFLELVMKCVDRRCKILGVDAPVRQELTGIAGGLIEIKVTYDDDDGTT